LLLVVKKSARSASRAMNERTLLHKSIAVDLKRYPIST
jgi:hypothetical protein